MNPQKSNIPETLPQALQVKNIGKSYDGRPVIRDVSLAVQPNEVVGLLGPNGAGKTTSFYIMVGLVAADYGSIYLDGLDVTRLPMYMRARYGVGYLPQESSIFRGLTVEQNIMAVLETVESSPIVREDILESLLGEFSISHLRMSPSITLSGGERRRLEMARALSARPKYVLLDEPLAGVDPVSVSEIAELVSQVKQQGIGVLITDHNVQETLGLVDRAYILHDGVLLKQGTPQEIVADEKVRQVYLGQNFRF